MKILFATTNPAKIQRYTKKLRAKGIEVLTLRDLGVNFRPKETGKSAMENACIKAEAYYHITHITTVGMDNALYIEKLSSDQQPGTHVRRVNEKELSDNEMIEYYSNLAKEHGGQLTAKWVFGVVIYNNNGSKEYSWGDDTFYLVDKPCKRRIPGYPLDSISIDPQCNKYFVDLTAKDKGGYNEDGVVDFIIKSLSKENLPN